MKALAVANRIYIVAGTIPVLDDGSDPVYNDSFIFSPSGSHGVQGKLHTTRFGRDEWNVSARSAFRIFHTTFGRLAITICYDVEFPEIARAAGREGAHIPVMPSCPDERQGFLRVRYGAQARAIENQMYVIQSCTVGSLPMVPAVSLHYGQASILTPSDFPFARDGILAEGYPNQEMMGIGDVNLETIRQSRSFGTVLPLLDSHRSLQIAGKPEVVRL
jgi:predicted amidohydrolase